MTLSTRSTMPGADKPRHQHRRRLLAGFGSALFFVVTPGSVAGFVPWWLTGWRVASQPPWWDALRVLGLVLTIAAALVLISAFVRFVTEGIGTPAPVAPTQHLVVGGVYRFVRNPMYVAVFSAIVGQALVLGQPGLLVYAAAVGLLMLGFARWFEERSLLERFGSEYAAYRRAVPGWWPRLRPWRQPQANRH